MTSKYGRPDFHLAKSLELLRAEATKAAHAVDAGLPGLEFLRQARGLSVVEALTPKLLERSIREARDAGATWDRIGEVTSLPTGTAYARWRGVDTRSRRAAQLDIDDQELGL